MFLFIERDPKDSIAPVDAKDSGAPARPRSPARLSLFHQH